MAGLEPAIHAYPLADPAPTRAAPSLRLPFTDPAPSWPTMKGGWVYIMASERNGTLYIGVTANLSRRVWEHREDMGSSFARKYGTKRLVYAERHDDIRSAIQRETSLKRWNRSWKIQMIERHNPFLDDLYDHIIP
jgi:putative endonuclease